MTITTIFQAALHKNWE